MMKAIDIRASSFEEFNEYLFGRKLAKLMNLFMLVMLLGVCAVMFSGAGALFHEQLGLSKLIGSITTSVLAIAVLIVGAKVYLLLIPLLYRY
ncbi:hypothetical protein ACI2OX_14260 [Bacillus sp. N9]